MQYGNWSLPIMHLSSRKIYFIAALSALIVVIMMIIAWIIMLRDNTTQTKDYVLLIQLTVVFLNSIVTAGLSVITVGSVNRSTEQLKARLSQLVPKKYDAYHSMWKAATNYFLALKMLELGEYPESQLVEAEKIRNLAIGESLLAVPEDVAKYLTFMQEVLHIKEKAETLKRESGQLKALWQEDGPKCGRYYEDLRENFYKRLLSFD